MAQWAEKDDRCLYLYFTKLQEEIEFGDHKEIIDNESIILEYYLDKYIPYRLTNKFLLDVSVPIIDTINLFESSAPRIYQKWDRMNELFFDIAGKFIKNAANLSEKNIKNVLEIDFSDTALHLALNDVYLGPQVDLHLKRQSLSDESHGPKAQGERARISSFRPSQPSTPT